ncbi:hypothetical protein AVEN_31191-1 [Araneus ventricosus]|uniref:Histone-lysine N-methyltransferase SETMAR n=1 Tax=Araneus ventricosus TaxID=182803 RepID=A0A4Y2KJG1_ARAVE|nr:hypothetical protein AVEN_31191-1 [Araneus ventricosus]
MSYSSAANSLSQVVTAFKQKTDRNLKGVLLVDFMPKGTAINANRYCEPLKNYGEPSKIGGEECFLEEFRHDNTCPHTDAATQEILDKFGWEIFDYPLYRPDLAPSDFHLFLKLKEFLGGKRFGSDEELENAVTTWLNELASEEYDMGILKLVDRYDKCLNVGGDYLEK